MVVHGATTVKIWAYIYTHRWLVVFVISGGGLSSGSGTYYLVLQGLGASIAQNITGLQPNTQYVLSFLTAERPLRGVVQRFSLFVNEQPLISNLYPFESFTSHTVSFTTNADGYAVIRFENSSPPGDASIFLDNIQMCSVPQCPTVSNGGFEANAHGELFAATSELVGWNISTPAGTQILVAANGMIRT